MHEDMHSCRTGRQTQPDVGTQLCSSSKRSYKMRPDSAHRDAQRGMQDYQGLNQTFYDNAVHGSKPSDTQPLC
jgi:hypothetical protein